jgi:DNA-binding MarR family transcriptional regulator
MLWVESYGGGRGHRVSPSQLRALLAIQQHGSTNLTSLSGDLGAILSSTSRLCDRLVAAGLVERSQSAGDRREVAMRLTAEGTQLLAAIERDRRTALGEVLASMSSADLTKLLSGLEAFRAVGQASTAVGERRTS